MKDVNTEPLIVDDKYGKTWTRDKAFSNSASQLQKKSSEFP